MRVVYITGSFEFSRDGVGDYTRLIARECERLGHAVCLIALNDRYINDCVDSDSLKTVDALDNPQSSDQSLNLIRLSSKKPWAERIKITREVIKKFSPDFVSLQFVCYGYHSKGIAWGLSSRLKEMIGTIPVHIMFHELWINEGPGVLFKHKFLGWVQRYFILKIINRLNVRVLHTSNPAYLALLQQNGIRSNLLPLFGNIPIKEFKCEQSDVLKIGIFGTIYPQWPTEPLLQLLQKTGKKIKIFHAGRMGAGVDLWEKMKSDYDTVFEFDQLGELSVEEISHFISSLDFGIATTSWELIGKSGTVAALLEHGIPVIVNRDDIHYKGWTETGYSPLLIKLGDDLPEKMAMVGRGVPNRILTDITRQFLNDLNTI